MSPIEGAVPKLVRSSVTIIDVLQVFVQEYLPFRRK